MSRYARQGKKKALPLSFQISSRHFVEYIKRHPEINEVYGLIGNGHINFLDKHAIAIDSSSNERHLQFEVAGRVIPVHLFGGTHGKMSHLDALATFAKQKGLTILDTINKKSNEDEILRLLLQILSASQGRSKIDTQVEHRSSHFEDWNMRKSPLEKNVRLDKAVEKFDFWMNHYTHHGEPLEEELINWLFQDSGWEFVHSYDEFQEFVAKLDQERHQIPMIPSQKEYEKGMVEAARRVRSRGY